MKYKSLEPKDKNIGGYLGLILSHAQCMGYQHNTWVLVRSCLYGIGCMFMMFMHV